MKGEFYFGIKFEFKLIIKMPWKSYTANNLMSTSNDFVLNFSELISIGHKISQEKHPIEEPKGHGNSFFIYS
jgi:hypothetical protein